MFRDEHPVISGLRSLGLFSELDLGLAGLALRAGGPDEQALALATTLVSLRTAQRHVCLNLEDPLGEIVPQFQDHPLLASLDPTNWINILLKSPAVGGPGDFTPFIMEGSRLYLARYHQYETEVVTGLLGLAERVRPLPNPMDLRAALDRLFPSACNPDRQKLAAFAALRGSLCVITGGPGTGKTTTVAKIIALLLEMSAGERPPRIGLAAPTGKAAARLSEAIRKARDVLNISDSVKECIPTAASTLHRLLGARPDKIACRYDQGNPLALDVLVVDEASMVDLPLMAKLLRAIPERARLILLGDKDQLMSVEAGAVLGDICGQEDLSAFSQAFLDDMAPFFGDNQGLPPVPAVLSGFLGDCIVELDRNYRFAESSGIAALSRAVRLGDAAGAEAVLKSGAADLVWHHARTEADLVPLVRSFVLEKYVGLSAESPEDSLTALESARMLSPLRGGHWGVEALNILAEGILRETKHVTGSVLTYHGRPLMVTSNDHVLRLFNGDTGIIMHEPPNERPWAVFRSPEKDLRRFPPARLPEHESVYAMTVHKSQGSEFEYVLLVIPKDNNYILTRELIYTAVTRAKKQLIIITSGELISEKVFSKIQRSSGLTSKLWDHIT